MTNPKTIVHFTSALVLLAAVLAWGGLASNVYADADSISINFGPQFGAPTGGNLGVVPVNWQYWNNAISTAGIGINKYTAPGDNSINDTYNTSGTISLISNTGADTGLTATWNCNNTYMYKKDSRPSLDNNAILFYGYLDDNTEESKRNRFSMTAPYFSYDIYYYASSDQTVTPFRYATINSGDYYGNASSGTMLGTSNWGTRVSGNINADDLKEGINYLKVSSTSSDIFVSGAANDKKNHRGSFAALQIVNTADSQSTIVTGGTLTWTGDIWTNDLTGETGQAYNSSAVGHRLINNGQTVTVDLGNTSINMTDVKILGTGSVTLTNGTTVIGQTNTSTDLSKFGGTLELPCSWQLSPHSSVKVNSGVGFTEGPSDSEFLTGAYFVDSSGATYFAKVQNGVFQAVSTTTNVDNDVDLLVTASKTDNVVRTLNSLTTQADYKSDQLLTITSGMITLQNASHWIQGNGNTTGGTITSAYQNANGEYDLYICGLGGSEDMRIDRTTIVDPDNEHALNIIKTGSGAVSLSNATRTETYSGKTIVLEGHLQIGEYVRSTDFYVARGAQLDFSSRNYRNNTDFPDFDVTATSLSGNGTVEIGNANGKIAMTMNNVANDGSKFARVNAYGKSLTMNNSALHTAVMDSKTPITLTNSSIVADTFISSADSSVVFDATSTLDAAIVTSAGALTLDIPANRTMDISEAITGAGGFVKAGEGTLELTANNAYSNNTQINGGVLDLTEGKLYSGTYFGNSHVYVNEGGTLKVNNFGYAQGEDQRGSLGGLSYASGTTDTTRFHMNGGTVQVTETFGEAIGREIELQENGGKLDIAEDVELKLTRNIHGAGALTKTGAGTLELTYANTYAGGTTISQGEVNLSGSGTLGTGTVAIAENAVLNLNHEGNARFDNSVTGVEVDSEMGYGKIYKNGNGVLKIYNPTEDAFVAESFVVNAGKLDFKGYFKGSLQIGDGATLSPGNSVGPIYETGDFTLASGAKLLLEVGAENGETAGDLLQVAGTATFASGSIIEIGLDETSQLKGGDEFELKMIVADNASDELATLVNSLLRSYYFTDLNATYKADAPDTGIWISGRLDPNAVPEPSTWALLILGAAGLLYWRKRSN